MGWNTVKYGVMAAGLSLAACDGGNATDDAQRYDALDGVFAGEAKADMVKNAHIIDDIPLGSEINGTFNPRLRVYGFTFEAKAGAEIKVNLSARGGADSFDAAGQPLDTVAALYGPIEGDDKGPRLAENDDNDNGLGAELPQLRLQKDGRYLVIFTSWNDPGAGQYDIGVECEGTNFQCQRPAVVRTCAEGTRYIQGQTVIGDETWSRCEVVLLENTLVEQDSILTIAPGVTVKGNFLGEGTFGNVGLQVDGQLQAVGSKDHPIVFTALRDGWKGIELNGSDNNIKHAFIEKAAIGVNALGNNNTITDTVIDHGETAIVFREDSVDNRVQRLKIEAVQNGIEIREGSQSHVIDTIIRGRSTDEGRGFSATRTTRTEVRGTTIDGFAVGAWFEGADTYFYDSTIARNGRGVHVTGPDGGVNPEFTCPAMPAGTTPSRPRPVVPTWRPRDPAFFTTDIVHNASEGIFVDAPQLLVVEDSNLTNNGAGLLIRADSLHTESRINNSNVFANGDALMQVDAWHTNGTLDISGNYWAQISDPELSQSWNVAHTENHACTARRSNINGCSRVTSRRYTCGAYTCNFVGNNNWSCTGATATASWTGEVEFTGFSPVELEAGPKLDELTADVNAVRVELGLDGATVTDPVDNSDVTIVISEIDYDQPGRDGMEFLEIQNQGETTIPLAGCIVEFVNGANDEVYMRYDLGDAATALEPGQYVVLGSKDLLRTVDGESVTMELTRSIQNGSPDGVRLVYAQTTIDGLAYEGAMPGVGEGDGASVRESNSGLNESLSRCGDTDDNSKDFQATLPTPGKTNLCQ